MSRLYDRLLRAANGEAAMRQMLGNTGTQVRGVAPETLEAHLRLVEELGERKGLSLEEREQMAADDARLHEFSKQRDRIAIDHTRKIQAYLHGIASKHYVDALDVGDVARYWREYLGGGLLYASTLPQIQSPFGAAFYEYLFPKGGLPGAFLGEEPERVGVLAFASSASGYLLGREGRTWDFSNLGHTNLPECNEGEVGLLMLFCYLEFGKSEVVGPICDMQVPVSEEGRAYADAEGTPALRTLTALGLDTNSETRERSPIVAGRNPTVEAYAPREHIYGTLGFYLAQPVLLANAFLNCSNVEPVAEEPPCKLSRRHEKRYGRPLAVYKTLRVSPGYGSTAGAARSGKDEERRRLHLCRGHFRTYRERGPGGRPLEEPMTIWISQHTRGGAEQGEVIKDYHVEEPASRPGPALESLVSIPESLVGVESGGEEKDG